MIAHTAKSYRLPALVLALLLLAIAPAAQARDCSARKDEIACLYDTLRKAATPSLRPLLAAEESDWRKQTAGCKDDCAAAQNGERVKRLRALAARFSEDNPGLGDANAAWLEGEWQPGPIVALDAFKAPDHVAGLLHPGTVISTAAGTLCRKAGACHPFGLEPQKLADSDRGALAGLLSLPADWPYYAVLFQGKAVYGIVPQRDGHLFAISVACETASDRCGYVRQEWLPQSADSRLVSVPAEAGR